MANKIFNLLLFFICSILLVGCDAAPSKTGQTLSKEEHREIFFDSIKPGSITDYQFYYSSVRSGYITFARLNLSTNVDLSFLNGYSEITSAQNGSEQSLLAETLYYRAISLLGDSNSIPAWLQIDKGSLCNYYQKKDKSSEWQLWWDKNQSEVFFIGIGTSEFHGK